MAAERSPEVQSPREVIDRLLRKRPAERVGLYDSPWGDTLKKWTGQGMPKDEKGEPVDPVEHFGFDMAGCGGGIAFEAKLNAGEVLEETDEWSITRNGSGAAFKYWKDKSGTPEHIDFLMTSREVWDRDYRPHLIGTERERVDVKAAAEQLERHRKQGFWAYYGNMFIWESMRASMGDYTMYMALVSDPEWIHDFNRVYTDLHKACYQILFEEVGRPDGIWVYEDLGYKGRLFCSPAILEKLIFPYYAELNAFFHSYDLPVVFHTCGFSEPALDLIVDAGFDALNPMEVKAGNRPLWIAEHYGDRLAFVGGLDERVLETGDREHIRREVAALVEGMKGRGIRYVYGSDHSISTNVDYEDFQYSLDVYREHAAY